MRFPKPFHGRSFSRSLACAVAAVCFPLVAFAEPRIEATQGEERIDIAIDGDLFTSYRYPSDWKFPYLWPVNGPESGKSVTIEKGISYPHHRSLYFGCDKVNGGNYWQDTMERGRIVSQGPEIVESGTRVVLEDACDWVRDGAPSPIRDRRRVTITAPDESERHIEFEIEIEFKIDTHVGRSNHALFAAEVVHELSVEKGGHILNAKGGMEEKGTWGVPAIWCDAYGERDGIVEGLAILQHPDNENFPWPYFTRDYGFMSPTPMQWIGEEGIDFQAGDKFSLKFLVVVHQGEPNPEKLNQLFEQWRNRS